MIHVSKTGSENNSNIGKKNCNKSHNLGTNHEKTWVLTFSEKYLHIYEINHSIKESSTKKKLFVYLILYKLHLIMFSISVLEIYLSS